MNKLFAGKLSFLLLIMLVVSAFSFGQGFFNTTNWRFSNPKQFGFTVLDLDFFDNNNVIAVGSEGGIAKSTDGGANWTYGVFTFNTAAGVITRQSFSDLHYATANVAYAVGGGGCMAKTTDGGATWSLVVTPLFSTAKPINAVYFLNKDTGYIGGVFNNTPDSLPKLYFTRNGGTTWDSLAAPISQGKSRVGYINNPNIPSVVVNLDSKAKDIQRIEFLNDSVGYVCGSGSSLFPRASESANGTTCLPSGGNLTGSAANGALLWKFTKGVLTDYSLSKERLGFTGIVTNTVTCTSSYNSAQVSPVGQTYRALNIINDSTIVMMSFNNNCVLKVGTGKNDSTLNRNVPGVYEKGKYQVLNFPFLPAGPDNGPSIPPVQVLLASNPYYMKKTASGKLLAGANFGLLWTSVDTGRNWVREWSLPQGRNYSSNGTWAIDVAPNGKILSGGSLGVVADSSLGNPSWNSNYFTNPYSAGYNKMEFVDGCNGMAVGGSFITVTNDGGRTWIDRANANLSANFESISKMSYVNLTKAYFPTNFGNVYRTANQGINLVPVFTDNNAAQLNDLSTVGNDSIWTCGIRQSNPPNLPAVQQGVVFRSFNNAATWDTIKVGPIGNTVNSRLTCIKFTSKTIGYTAGSRGYVFKSTDAGATWNNISPFFTLTPAITYSAIFALDNNTIFLIGQGFPRKVVYKTIDGGTTWTDITSNLAGATPLPVGNLNGILMHDINNGYIMTPGAIVKTNDGGATWILDLPPTGCLFQTAAFVPAVAPAGTLMANRKTFMTGANISGAPIMEYGNHNTLYVNSTETVTNTNCSNPSGGAITINASGGTPPLLYSINGGPFQASNTFTGLTAGVKNIAIKDFYCDTLRKAITIGFTDNLTLTKNNDTTVCAGAPVQMVATSNAATFAWSPAAGLSNAAISNPIAINSSNATYTVTATLNTCVKTGTVRITIKPNPIISAGADKTIVSGDVVTLDGVASNAVSIAWTPNTTLTGANTLTPTAKPTVTTTYLLTVVDNNSCTSTDDAKITVIPYCLNVQNAFSPNGDGINDKWVVTNGSACTSQIIAKVFNRYGSEMYTNDNYQNNWDGTYKGKPVPDGTYYYVLTYKLINGTAQTLKGDVTVLR